MHCQNLKLSIGLNTTVKPQLNFYFRFMLSFPCAKINIGLNVLRKREDGYHDISSCFYPVRLFDALEITPAAEMTLHISGMTWQEDLEKNSCMLAYRALSEITKLPAYSINLIKKIPVGAGLGGGSSDAASMLKMLNEEAEMKLEDARLEAIAARIGSDCPFFIQARPAIASGRGEVLIPSDLSLKGYFIVLVKPDFQISTTTAYQDVQPSIPAIGLEDALKSPISMWKDLIKNDFETHLFKSYPELAIIKDEFYKKGALYASLSGSGSVVYGIFKTLPAAADFIVSGTITICEG